MDMRKHLTRWLNDPALVRLGGTFEGVIRAVTEQTVRNRFTAKREVQPVILFEEGWQLIPNATMRTALVEMFGHDTETWTGRQIRIFRRERVNHMTGEVLKGRWEKAVMCPDPYARAPVGGPIRAGADGDGKWPELADYDDSDEALGQERGK